MNDEVGKLFIKTTTGIACIDMQNLWFRGTHETRARARA